MFTKHLAAISGARSSIARVSVPHSNKLHTPIFRAAVRRGIARGRASISMAFGAQAAAVDSMIRKPVHHGLCAITREFQISFLRSLIVRKSLNANLPVRMLLERSCNIVQCALGIRR